MSPAQVAILGAIAGSTIFLGLPIGRMRAPMPRLKTGLNAVATGILVFLLWDVLTHAWAPVDEALSHHEIGDAAAKGVVLAATVGVGLLGRVWVDRFVSRHRGARVGGVGAVVGPRFVNDIVSIAFLGLAAGSILYVVIELLAVARKADLKTITTWGIFAGLILGFATDAIITAAGV